MKRRQKADGQVKAGAGIADLRAGDKRCAIGNTGGAHRAAHRLRHVFIGLEFRVRAGRTEAFDRADHDLRIDLVNFFPGETQPLQHAGAEVLHHDVALLQQVDKHFLALRRLHVDRDRALVAVQHREIQAVRARNVTQLSARGVTLRRFELDHICTHPRQQLRAGRPACLYMRHVEDTYALECFHLILLKCVLVFLGCGCGGWIKTGDAAAFGTGGFVDDCIDQRGFLRADGFFHCLPQFRRRRRVHADTAECFHQLIVTSALDEHGRRGIAVRSDRRRCLCKRHCCS